MDSPMVSLARVTKDFITEAGPVHALRPHLNLAIGQGEFVALMGPSGSGKSTLLSLLAGLDRPTSGSVVVAGRELTGLTETELALFRSENLGFIFQSFNLIATMTALENVELPARFSRKPIKNVRRRATELLELVGLRDRMNHLPSQLSGGQQQRVAIARALVNSPALILGDEPTGNLDSDNGLKVIDLLDNLRNTHNATLVLATHDPRVAARADRIIVLQDGLVMGEESA